MYVEQKKIGNNTYMYLKVSARHGGTVRTKTIAYLGKGPMSKKEIQVKIATIPKEKIGLAKKELTEKLEKNKENINSLFLDAEQLKYLAKIQREFIQKLKNPDKKLLDDMFRDFKTYYVYNTNAIEGNTLTLKETNLLLNSNQTPEGKDLREIYDHINEKETFDYLLSEKPEIDLALIIKIHSMLLKNIDNRTGSFRAHNVRVFGASFKTSPAEYVKADIGLLMKWHKKNKKMLHPLVLAAIFHEKFERIHPFYDGNGRTGRMLLNLMLLKNKSPLLIIKNKSRKEYYDVLSAGHKAGLTSSDPKYYKPLVRFCYTQLVESYKTIFSKWG